MRRIILVWGSKGLKKRKNKNQTGSIICVNDERVEVATPQKKSSFFFRLDRIKKQQKRMFPYLLTGTATLGMVSVFFLESSLSKLGTVSFEGNTFLTKGTILELTGLTTGQSILEIHPSALEAQIEAHPLVKKADISFTGLNDLSIKIEEEQVLGCVSSNQRVKLLLSEGILVDNSVMSGQTCQGVYFYDMDELPEEMNLMYLTNALNELDPDFIALIDAVYYEPELGDIYRFSIHLKDGNVIKVNTYTMAEKLSYYPTLLKKVKATYGDVQGTFYLDVGDRFVVHDSQLEQAIEFYETRGEANESEDN